MYPYPEHPLLWMKGIVDTLLFGAVYVVLHRAYNLPWREPAVTAFTVVVMIGWFIPLLLMLYMWAFTWPVARLEHMKHISTAAMFVALSSVILLPVLSTAFAASLLVHVASGWHQAITFVAGLLVTAFISVGGAMLVQGMIAAAATRRHKELVALSRASMKAKE